MALWAGVLLPFVVTAAEMETNFVLVRQACAGHRMALYVVVVAGLVIISLSGLISAVMWRRGGREWPVESNDILNRSRFIAVLGMFSAALSFALVLAHGIATLKFDPCQL